eukprot:3728498-Amphidinium_carterae.3
MAAGRASRSVVRKPWPWCESPCDACQKGLFIKLAFPLGLWPCNYSLRFTQQIGKANSGTGQMPKLEALSRSPTCCTSREPPNPS